MRLLFRAIKCCWVHWQSSLSSPFQQILHPDDFTGSYPGQLQCPGLRMGLVPIRPSCITFQPTFPTVSTQKDWRTETRIHFSWRLENGLLYESAESLEITHANLSVTLHWSIQEFQLKDQNCSGQTDWQWWSHTSTLWSEWCECKLDAKMTFRAD